MFSLRKLFVVVGIAAIAVAAVVSEVTWLAASVVGAVVVLLLWGLVEFKEPFWRAFSVFGIGYMLIACVPVFVEIKDALPSTMLLNAALGADEKRLADPYHYPFGSQVFHARMMAGQCAFALLLGSIAGFVYQRRARS